MSSFRKRLKKQKKELLKRTKEQHESKDDQGGSFGDVFIKSAVPEGVGFWNPGKDDHIIDIIPFLAGANHPNVAKGELSYVADIWVHRNVGAMNEQFVCPAKNYKMPCVICEYIAKERLPKAEWDKHRAYRRVVYLVWVKDEGDEQEKGIQIWEVAHWNFEKEIDERAKKKRGGGYTVFSDPDDGKSISFSIKASGSYVDAGGTKRESIDFAGHQFEDRDGPIPDEILDTSFCLDDAINTKPDYDEMTKAFHGGSTEKPSDPDDEDLPPDETETPDDEIPDDQEQAEDETSETETEDETPKTETDDSGEGCPHDHTFGADIDQKDQCDECNKWDNCSDEADKLASG